MGEMIYQNGSRLRGDKVRMKEDVFAVRAAVRGDDISKRQLTTEQAWHRCASGEMGKDEKASSQAGKDLNHKSSSTYGIKHKGQSRA
ncbi:hypothetical protein ES288_A11G105300v1 [Gossypium darwinii]|uniref:Uncharacterized protein n=1 Tax=Gossypium darwinii TaxID=34276 RepID=A0A5D2EJS4_GOSDA|nr:hypothetical protein ES288_A11G105300v1 [Gossypium darwinii]